MRLTSRYFTGNSVANYSIYEGYCEACRGEGLITVDYDGLRNYLDGQGYTFSERKYIVCRWKSTEEVSCLDCRGTGNGESWL